MLMPFFVAAAIMVRGTDVGVRRVHLQGVFFQRAVAILVVQAAVVEIVDVPFMLDRGVAAVRTMLMIVMLVWKSHGKTPRFGGLSFPSAGLVFVWR
jgi:hypothetical protein